MFAGIVVAGLLVIGGPTALAQTTAPEPNAIWDAQPPVSARVQLAADLGCPHGFHRRYGYDQRCYRRHARPYGYDPRGGYGRHDEERYGDPRSGRYADRDALYYEDNGVREEWNGPDGGTRYRDERPPRRGAYDERGPRDPYNGPSARDPFYDNREFSEEPYRRRGDDLRPYRDSSAPIASGTDYAQAGYSDADRKKKGTDRLMVTAAPSRTAAFDAGSIA